MGAFRDFSRKPKVDFPGNFDFGRIRFVRGVDILIIEFSHEKMAIFGGIRVRFCPVFEPIFTLGRPKIKKRNTNVQFRMKNRALASASCDHLFLPRASRSSGPD